MATVNPPLSREWILRPVGHDLGRGIGALTPRLRPVQAVGAGSMHEPAFPRGLRAAVAALDLGRDNRRGSARDEGGDHR